MATKEKLTGKQWLAITVAGLAFTATCGVSYFINYYYAIYQEATGFTDGQIGTILSSIGIIAVISYLFGGPLADKVRSKVLLIFCCLSTAVCSLVMLTFPRYEIMLVVQIVLGLCALLPHYAPLCKFITTIGNSQDQTNKLWGIYTAVVGASGALIGFIGTAIINHFNDAKIGMRIIILMFVALEIFCACMFPVVDKSKHGDPVSKGGGSFKLSDIGRLLTMPKMWLVFISLIGIYLTAFAFTYIMPLLTNVFMVPLAMVTLISTIRANLIKVVSGPAAGTLAAKLHTSHKANLILYVVAFIGMLLLVLIPWGKQSIALAIVAVVILAFAYSASTTYWTPLVSDAGIPNECLGTAIGFSSVVMTLPDTFAYKLAGNAIEANGESAYKGIFLVVLAAYVVGAIANTILIRVRKKELAAEAEKSENAETVEAASVE